MANLPERKTLGHALKEETIRINQETSRQISAGIYFYSRSIRLHISVITVWMLCQVATLLLNLLSRQVWATSMPLKSQNLKPLSSSGVRNISILVPCLSFKSDTFRSKWAKFSTVTFHWFPVRGWSGASVGTWCAAWQRQWPCGLRGTKCHRPSADCTCAAHPPRGCARGTTKCASPANRPLQ